MQHHFEYIQFYQRPPSPNRKTQIWDCKNRKSGAALGMVRWYPNWRQYCFEPFAATVFSSGCLADVIAFVESANKNHRSK